VGCCAKCGYSIIQRERFAESFALFNFKKDANLVMYVRPQSMSLFTGTDTAFTPPGYGVTCDRTGTVHRKCILAISLVGH
jgi:hypothetical protein